MERRLRGLGCPRSGAGPKRRRGPPPPPPTALASDSEGDEGPRRRRPPRRASRVPDGGETSPAAIPESDPEEPNVAAAGQRAPALRLDSDTDVEEPPDVRPAVAAGALAHLAEPGAVSGSDTDVEGAESPPARCPDVSAAPNGRASPGSDTDVEAVADTDVSAAPNGLRSPGSDTDVEVAADTDVPAAPNGRASPGSDTDVEVTADTDVSAAPNGLRSPRSDTDVEAVADTDVSAPLPALSLDSDTDTEEPAARPDVAARLSPPGSRLPDVAPPDVRRTPSPSNTDVVEVPDVGGQAAAAPEPDVASGSDTDVEELPDVGGRVRGAAPEPDVGSDTDVELVAPTPDRRPPRRAQLAPTRRPPVPAVPAPEPDVLPETQPFAPGPEPDVLPETQLFAPSPAGRGAEPAAGPRSPGAGEESAGDAEDEPELFLEATQNFLPPAPGTAGAAEEPPEPAPPPDAWAPPAAPPPEVGAGLRRSQRLARSRGGGTTEGAEPPAPSPAPPRRSCRRPPQPQEPPAKRGRGQAEPRPSEPRPAKARPQPRPRQAAASPPGSSRQEPAEPEVAATRPRPQRCPRGDPGSTPPKVLFTGVVAAAGTVAALGLLGGSVAASVFDCTHLVTDRVRRTVKFLCALARGVPIVTPEWLLKSARSGCVLAPGAFLVRDAEQERGLGFSLAAALRRARRRGLLEGYEVHVTPSVRPEPELMRDIIACSGGTFLPAMPHVYGPRRLVISCAADAGRWGPALGARLPLASAELLLTGLLRQRLDLEPFRLPGPEPAAAPPARSPPRRRPRRRRPR
ncbi:mediator of DNA damage checkpoint protein 1 [Struthio camelus]|uniref:mediator of DNA damage checkpoint protein 1 n=1 Tax=Struthio camelus TaxID=8801 RepID=UPI0036042A14